MWDRRADPPPLLFPPPFPVSSPVLFIIPFPWVELEHCFSVGKASCLFLITAISAPHTHTLTNSTHSPRDADVGPPSVGPALAGEGQDVENKVLAANPGARRNVDLALWGKTHSGPHASVVCQGPPSRQSATTFGHPVRPSATPPTTLPSLSLASPPLDTQGHPLSSSPLAIPSNSFHLPHAFFSLLQLSSFSLLIFFRKRTLWTRLRSLFSASLIVGLTAALVFILIFGITPANPFTFDLGFVFLRAIHTVLSLNEAWDEWIRHGCWLQEFSKLRTVQQV